MDKKWIICIIITIVLGLLIGIALALYTSNSYKDTQELDILSEKILAEEKNKEAMNLTTVSNTIETVAKEEVISPNALLIEKVYYEGCDHLIRKTKDMPEKLVNKGRKEIEQEYDGWKIEEYSSNQVVVYKTQTGNCGEHYFVQEHNGVIGIYTTDEYGVKTLKEDTEIATQYLPEPDLQKLKAGVEIIGYTKLVEFLEDFE